MPALIPTKFSAKVTWLGLVPDRHSDLCAVPQTELMMRFSGPEGDSHSGLTRPSCSRVTSQHPRGTEIRNVRQLSIVSAEDLQQIAATIGLEVLDPAWLGATLVLSGIVDFSHLPPGSRLQATNGTTLVIDMENRPCNLPARARCHPPDGTPEPRRPLPPRPGAAEEPPREGPCISSNII